MGWLNILNKIGLGEAQPPPPKPPEITPFPLKADQYYPTKQKKTHIFCHHSAGGSAASSIAWWAKDPKRIATPYIIDRDGTIYETFDPSFWAFHLGVKNNQWLEKQSIGIELCSYGQLTQKFNGDFVNYLGKPVSKEKAVQCVFRGFLYYEAYTPEQIKSLSTLLPYLLKRFGITPQQNRKDFWEFHLPDTLPPGIWSHTSVRKDKFDIFPQKELVDLVYSL